MNKKTFHGSCHCKKVTFEADLDLSAGTTKCDCTLCWKHRFWGTKTLPLHFRLISGADTLSAGDRGGFCKGCGVMTHLVYNTEGWQEGVPGRDEVSINVASLDNLEVSELLAAPVTFCDGRNNNWWHPPAKTAHL